MVTSEAVETCLCVGGPYDGRRVTVESDRDHVQFGVCDAMSIRDTLMPHGHTTALYHRVPITTGNKVLSVFIFSEVRDQSVVALLIEGYRTVRRVK